LSEIIIKYSFFHLFQNVKVTPWIISTVTAVAGTTFNIYIIVISHLIFIMIVILSVILLILLFCEIFRQNIKEKNYQKLSIID